MDCRLPLGNLSRKRLKKFYELDHLVANVRPPSGPAPLTAVVLLSVEEYLHDLFEEFQDALEDSKDFIAQSKKAKERSKELLAAARDFRIH